MQKGNSDTQVDRDSPHLHPKSYTARITTMNWLFESRILNKRSGASGGSGIWLGLMGGYLLASEWAGPTEQQICIETEIWGTTSSPVQAWEVN